MLFVELRELEFIPAYIGQEAGHTLRPTFGPIRPELLPRTRNLQTEQIFSL